MSNFFHCLPVTSGVPYLCIRFRYGGISCLTSKHWCFHQLGAKFNGINSLGILQLNTCLYAMKKKTDGTIITNLQTANRKCKGEEVSVTNWEYYRITLKKKDFKETWICQQVIRKDGYIFVPTVCWRCRCPAHSHGYPNQPHSSKHLLKTRAAGSSTSSESKEYAFEVWYSQRFSMLFRHQTFQLLQ